jgi:hypothetical protein
MGRPELHSSASGRGNVARCCVNGNEISSFIQCAEFTDWLRTLIHGVGGAVCLLVVFQSYSNKSVFRNDRHGVLISTSKILDS